MIKTLSLSEIIAGAKRASACFDKWPQWKKNLSMPQKKAYKNITVGWNSSKATVTDEYCSIEVEYEYLTINCCCGNCWNSYGGEGVTSFEIDRADIIRIAKTMGIKPEELK